MGRGVVTLAVDVVADVLANVDGLVTRALAGVLLGNSPSSSLARDSPPSASGRG